MLGSCHKAARPVHCVGLAAVPSCVRGGVLTMLHGVPVTHTCSLLHHGARSLCQATCWTGRSWERTNPQPHRGARWAEGTAAEHALGPAIRAPCRRDASCSHPDRLH